MKIYRIYGITLRYLYLFRRNPDKMVDVFYWPTIDLILWGITTIFIKSLEPGFSTIVIMIVSGIIFWQAVWRGQIEITVNILEELWNKNLVNIFIAPLKFSEWVSSFLILGFSKLLVSFSFVSLLAFILFKVKIFLFGLYLAPLIILLLMNGWWMGIMIGSVVLRFGTRVQNLTWSFPWAFSPFFGIFYPISILPDWAQKVSAIFPTSYIFEGVRQIINTGQMDPNKIVMSFVLNVVYLSLAVLMLKRSFNKALGKGLLKVY